MGDGRSFHFLVSSSISFFNDLKFLSYKFSTCLVRVTLRYFMLFVAIMKDVEHFLKCLLAILDSSVESSRFRSVLQFLLNYVFF